MQSPSTNFLPRNTVVNASVYMLFNENGIPFQQNTTINALISIDKLILHGASSKNKLVMNIIEILNNFPM